MRKQEAPPADEPVRVVRSPHAGGDRAYVMGPSYSRLAPDSREIVDALYDAGWHLRAVQADIERLVIEARESGVTWHVIGLSLGTTGENARKRYLVAVEVAGAGSDDE